MPLDEKNIELIIRLVATHQQRYTEIMEVGQRLLNPSAYRSRDGSLVLGQFSEAEKERLIAKLEELLDEAQVIANNIRQELGS
jgi:hypothetical protein